MSYQIDQSGKIEHTNKFTVIALANGKVKTIKITAAEKQRLVKAAKEITQPKKNYIYKLFAVLIFLITKDQKIALLEIDKEYPGHESVIKDTLIYLYKKYDLPLPEMDFVLVGRKSNCHKHALAVYRQKEKPTIIVKTEKIFETLFGAKLSSFLENPVEQKRQKEKAGGHPLGMTTLSSNVQ